MCEQLLLNVICIAKKYFLNTEFLEEAMAKAEVFFKQVVLPELMTGHVKKAMKDACTACSVAGDEEKGEPEFPCGKCGRECPEEPKEIKEMSIGCDRCNPATGNALN